MHVGVTSDAGSSGSRRGVSVHVAEVEADYKVHLSVLDGEAKGLNQVEGVEEGCHCSLHKAALGNTITWHLQAKQACHCAANRICSQCRAHRVPAHMLKALRCSVQGFPLPT